jgi:hypothetical protein
MRYVIVEDHDDIEQRCLTDGCGFVNGVFEEPRRTCPLDSGTLGAFPAYGTKEQRSKRLRHIEASLYMYRR